MEKTTAISKLQASRSVIASLGVSKIGLFGSTVRGMGRLDSDVDILIDFAEGNETFRNFVSVCDVLEKTFDGVKVDVVTLKGLSPFVGKQILNEVEYV